MLLNSLELNNNMAIGISAKSLISTPLETGECNEADILNILSLFQLHFILTCIMNHDSGFIIGITHVFAKTV